MRLIDPYGSGLNLPRNPLRLVQVTPPNRCRQAIRRVIRTSDDIFNVAILQQRQHWAESLLDDTTCVFRRIVDQGDRDEETRTTVRYPSEKESMPFPATVLKQIAHLVVLHFVLQRSKLDTRLDPVTHLHVLGVCDQFSRQLVINILMDIETLAGHAELRTVGKRGPEQFLGQPLGINIGQYNGRLVATRDHVQHPGRKNLLCQLAKPERAKWCEGRRFQNHGIAGQQRWRNLPDCQEQWKIPGRDGANDTDGRMTRDHLRVILAQDDLVIQALFGDLPAPMNGASYFPLSACTSLALLGNQQVDEGFLMFFNNVSKGLYPLLPLGNGRSRPCRKSCFRCVNSGVQMLTCRHREIADWLLCRWIDGLGRLGAGYPPAINAQSVGDFRHDANSLLLVVNVPVEP